MMQEHERRTYALRRKYYAPYALACAAQDKAKAEAEGRPWPPEPLMSPHPYRRRRSRGLKLGPVTVIPGRPGLIRLNLGLGEEELKKMAQTIIETFEIGGQKDLVDFIKTREPNNNKGVSVANGLTTVRLSELLDRTTQDLKIVVDFEAKKLGWDLARKKKPEADTDKPKAVPNPTIQWLYL